MSDPQDRLSRLTDAGKSQGLLTFWPVVAIIVVLALGGVGYRVWSEGAERTQAETQGDTALAKPSAEECQVGQTLVTSLHASGDDTKLAQGVGAKQVRLASGANSLANLANAAGYQVLAPEETANADTMQPGDWRWCPGLGAFTRGLGWSAMGGDEDLPELTFSRPAFNKAGTEAQLTEVFTPPSSFGLGLHDKGASFNAHRLNRIITLTKAANGAWSITSAKDIVPPKPADA